MLILRSISNGLQVSVARVNKCCKLTSSRLSVMRSKWRKKNRKKQRRKQQKHKKNNKQLQQQHKTTHRNKLINNTCNIDRNANSYFLPRSTDSITTAERRHYSFFLVSLTRSFYYTNMPITLIFQSFLIPSRSIDFQIQLRDGWHAQELKIKY